MEQHIYKAVLKDKNEKILKIFFAITLQLW